MGLISEWSASFSGGGWGDPAWSSMQVGRWRAMTRYHSTRGGTLVDVEEQVKKVYVQSNTDKVQLHPEILCLLP